MPRTHARVRRAGRPLLLLLAAVLAVGACSGGEESPVAAPTPTDSTTEPSPEPKVWPLTGERAARLPARRAVVVKIENTGSSEPQLGLGSADLVVRQLVEGGLTRLAAFYYSSLPARVGPVRSLRGTDIGIVKPAKALTVASGSSPRVMRKMRRAHVVTATEGASGFYRVSDRPAPYNLFVRPKRLPKDKLRGPKPQRYLPFGRAGALGKGRPARTVDVAFSGVSSARWRWTGRVWRRSGSHAASGDEFRPDNLLALRVRQVDAGYRDPAGNPVPESVLSGKGEATLFHRGRAYEGTWSKKTQAGPLRLVTARGRRLPVPPGRTWIELVPASGGSLRYGR